MKNKKPMAQIQVADQMQKFNRVVSLFSLMALCALMSMASPPATASPWLIATPDETAYEGAPLMLEVVRPVAQEDWPRTLKLRMVRNGRAHEVEIAAVETASPEDTRRTYRGLLPANLSGLVRVDLAEAESNRLVLVVSTPDPIERMQAPEVADAASIKASSGIDNTFFSADEPALSANEPMYFVLGDRTGLNARFQFSFKYRIFDPDSYPVAWFPPLSGLNFAYTQTSIWDLGADSAPFRDTSYRPSFFWQGATFGKGLMPDLLRAGYEHESNGKDNESSRSLNLLFAQPIWRTEFSDGRALVFAPKIVNYIDKVGNSDIQRYRGYVDWNLRYGRDDSWLLATQLRHGTGGYASAQLDLSYPLRKPLFARTGGFLHLQLFRGYGESLLDYNTGQDTQIRLGFSIVR
ncbi:MAG: phospholipase A [Methylotenera sp.]|nr:phospholipase A [Methylotenera sp.]